MKKDLQSDIKVINALDTQAISTDTTTNGDVIDTQGYNSIVFVLQAGTLTDGTYTPVIEEGDNSGLSDAAAVTDFHLLPSGTGQEAAAALDTSNTVSKLGVISNKRYLRLSVASTSTTSGGTVGGVAVLGHPVSSPVS